MSVYWIIVAIVIIFGQIMPQEGPQRKYYVILMNIVHTFVCAFRYQYLSGDLIKYHTEYRHIFAASGYFAEEVLHDWTNTGFYWLMKFVADVTNCNYTVFLIILAFFCCGVTAVMIYRFSPKPWFSYLIWDCMAFYLTYDFLAIKQGLAMAVLMISMMYIFDRRPLAFLISTLVAGFIHAPALCFLPAYFIATRRVDFKLIIVYAVAAAVIYACKAQIVAIVSEIYYEESSFTLVKEELGGRTVVIIFMLVAGWLLKGFREKRFTQLFNIVVVAAIFQSFSGFDNVFTRLADYYLQFTILYIPLITYDAKGGEVYPKGSRPVFLFNSRSRSFIAACLSLVMIWWYDTTCLGHTISYQVDNYLNYRFAWEVGTKWFW